MNYVIRYVTDAACWLVGLLCVIDEVVSVHISHWEVHDVIDDDRK